MAIRVTCGECQKSLSVKDEYAGKTGKCPGCGSALVIPAATQNLQADTSSVVSLPKPPAAVEQREVGGAAIAANTATAAKDPNQVMREILAGFHGDFARVRPTIGYRLAALIVAIVMILLPLVYVALVGVVGYALYWHAATNHVVLAAARGRNAKGAAFVYFGPLIVGGALILFMIKPLFARQPQRDEELELTLGSEPVLHSFVQRLCDAVNAPRPSLIEVDCEVNAAAYFRNGWWGFFTNDMALRIGLPLMSALDTRQLAGILAHELGHFSQGGGMRLTYIIRSINFWFVRVIYERDSWDQAITEWRGAGNGWVIALAGLTSLLVWLTRRVLWCLMVVGHGVSCALLRQMEYDADKYEARLAGSNVFESTMRKVNELGMANSFAHQIIASNIEQAGLPNDLPLCLSKVANKLPPEVTEISQKMIEEGKTGWFDSHPASRDRIEAAHRQQAPGIFQLERPAQVLLRDHTKLALNATLQFYRRYMPQSTIKQQLTPTDTFLSTIGAE